MTDAEMTEALQHDAEVPTEVKTGQSADGSMVDPAEAPVQAQSVAQAGDAVQPKQLSAQFARAVSVKALLMLQGELNKNPYSLDTAERLLGIADRADMLADKLELGSVASS